MKLKRRLNPKIVRVVPYIISYIAMFIVIPNLIQYAANETGAEIKSWWVVVPLCIAACMGVGGLIRCWRALGDEKTDV